MKLLILVAIITLAIGVLFSNRTMPTGSPTISDNQSVLSQVSEESVDSTPTSIPTQTFSPTSSPANTRASGNYLVGKFKYENSSVISQNSSSFILESFDSPEEITAWYKEKISKMGLTVKTFVSTKTNGDILNKLVVGSSELKVSIEIKKLQNENTTHMTISFE